jgi:hypothetical protein
MQNPIKRAGLLLGLKVTMSDRDEQEEYSPEETERRAQAAIKRALNTPPKPHGKRPAVSKKPKTSSSPRRSK